MSITVGELMRLPHLQMTLIAGGSGADREVSWVHTSDLPNAWEWHGAGELLLTNGTGFDENEPLRSISSSGWPSPGPAASRSGWARAARR
jgi:hypothetical protein